MRGSASWLLGVMVAAAACAGTVAQARDQGRMGLGAPDIAKGQPAHRAASASVFGARLAAVARRQTSHLVFYNSAYRQIAYPMGDVPRYFGVCTDVVVRAYRALGIDLQVLVHKSGAGSGDANIDHRRVEVLRRFFARAGTSLPITANPADYQPGDIVTYYHAERLALQDAHRHRRRREGADRGAAGDPQPRLGRAGRELAVCREDHRPLPLRRAAVGPERSSRAHHEL